MNAKINKAKFGAVLVVGLFVAAGILMMNPTNSDMTANAEKNHFGVVNLIDEGFENTAWPPDGWSTNTYFWFQGPVWGESSHSGSHHAYSSSANDSMITPSVEFDLNTELSFWYES
jgi:hypothetical protein